jgi:23S rRNA pseudouridine2605 synthase
MIRCSMHRETPRPAPAAPASADGSPSGERLQKLLAAAGHGSRRGIEEWIRAGRVRVDGRVATLGERVTGREDIRLDDRPLVVAAPSADEHLLYHKPVGEITTRSDPQGRPTVFERLPAPLHGRWIVVGRLDVNTAGLLLFTTDGALAHALMHPSAEVEREYLVRLRGRPPADVLERLRRGVELEDGPARFDSIRATEGPAEGGHAWYRVTLHEGRNREVRRLWLAVGYEVSRLVRLRYGPIELPRDLRPGQWRRLDPAQVTALRASLRSR